MYKIKAGFNTLIISHHCTIKPRSQGFFSNAFKMGLIFKKSVNKNHLKYKLI